MADAGGATWAALLLDHSSWATLEVLSFCEGLTPHQLAASTPGTFGTIFETLHHFIESDGHYVRRIAPELWPADMDPDADGAWTASLGGPEAFEWVRNGGPEASRLERRRQAFLSGNLADAFALLRARAETVARLWREYLRGDPDPSALIAMPSWSFEAAPAVLAAMAIGHADEHREQIRAILTSLDVEPPNIGAVAWARTRGLLRSLPHAR
ncbi:MAG: hypothetical protein LC792_05525 [Actinobacteria bacterium]|nr:hypothetical protein [Actinomycetota bacterium]